MKAVALDLAIKGRRVGYIPGAGDRVAEGLEEMGYEVTRLAGTDLTPEKLANLDAVVIGVRAMNVVATISSPTCRRSSPTLKAAGRSSPSTTGRTGSRRTASPLTTCGFPTPASPTRTRRSRSSPPTTRFSRRPTKICASDMEGWVQERGIYFPTQWDAHFTPILASGDPGEAPLKGGLLVAKHGRGHFVYTGLVFFRQLPAGVPGAYRLFANLVSLGK